MLSATLNVTYRSFATTLSKLVISHTPCSAPTMLRQCRVLRESPRGSRKYPNCYSNSLTGRFLVVCCYHSLQSWGWIVVRIGMLLITIFVELRVVGGRSRTRAGSPQTVSRRPCCDVALRKRYGQSMAWVRHGKWQSDTAALCKSNGKDTF